MGGATKSGRVTKVNSDKVKKDPTALKAWVTFMKKFAEKNPNPNKVKGHYAKIQKEASVIFKALTQLEKDAYLKMYIDEAAQSNENGAEVSPAAKKGKKK